MNEPNEISDYLLDRIDDGEPAPTIKDWLLYGDICHPGVILVHAVDIDEAVAKADAGEFLIHDEQDDCLAFQWTGTVFDLDGNEVDLPPADPIDTRTGVRSVAETIKMLEWLRKIEDDYDDQMARDQFLDGVGCDNFDDAELALLRDLRDLI